MKENTYNDCSKLREMNLPENLEAIGKDCFRNTKITEIVIPKSVKIIESSAFWGCRGLHKVVFDKGSEIKDIGKDIFSGCANLKEISLPEGLENIGGGCFKNTGIQQMVIPKSVKVIQERAFQGCRGLREVVFREGSELQEIKARAFYNCVGLRTFGSPPSLRELGESAFAGTPLEHEIRIE